MSGNPLPVISPELNPIGQDSQLGCVNMHLGMVKNMPGGAELKKSLALPADRFMLRWSAD
jgi:hypothetical protein